MTTIVPSTTILLHGDSLQMIDDIFRNTENIVIVTDPPFNIGYKYNSYKDKKSEIEYYDMLFRLFHNRPSVVIHYAEQLHKLSIKLGYAPDKVVSWVYNSNTAKQHRQIAFYGITPDFRKVSQPYKNLNDKRIKSLLASGKQGAKLYDWWNINQVKNVSKEKADHPCQMPKGVMDNIVGILPAGVTVLDPFSGSGATLAACKRNGINCIGIEIDEKYFSESKERLGL